MPKVSIIVPIYNTAPYLEMCLASLTQQTLQDIEIICVNDGSRDESQAIVDRFAKQDPYRIISIRKPNGGLSDARNVGLQEAKGEYIAFLDSDDYVDKTLYQQLHRRAVQTSADIVVCGFQRETENGDVLSVEQQALREQYESLDAILAVAPAAWNKLYRRDLWVRSQIRYPRGLWYEDLPTTFKLLLHANHVATVNESLIHYVQHDQSISYTFDTRAYDIFTVLEDMRVYLAESKQTLDFSPEEWVKLEAQLEALSLIHLIFAHLFRVASLKQGGTREDIQQVRQYLALHYPHWIRNRAIYQNLSWLKKGCVAIGLVCFKCRLFGLLLWVYREVNRLRPVQSKW